MRIEPVIETYHPLESLAHSDNDQFSRVYECDIEQGSHSWPGARGQLLSGIAWEPGEGNLLA